ncbi:hypothetical protein ACQPW1_45530 [Nocardia sp. CA-128927]|uniref:hypothetical protein n=1 Tax=Nocardia sp. CA-128927 TaxID=3239975 RepID=UPI003D95C5ED
MFDQLTIGSWVIVDEHCSVRRAPLRGEDYLTFVFESGGSEFEFALAPGVFRRMIDLAAAAPSGPDEAEIEVDMLGK